MEDSTGPAPPLIGQVDRLIESTRKITGFVPPSNVVHGAAGGVVVQQFAIRNDAIASVRYFYTDVLVMLALGISQGATKARHVGRLVDSIMDDTKKPTSRVGVGLGFFVEAKDVAALLCLAGLQSATTSGWRSDLLRLGELTGQVVRDSHLKLRIAQALATLSVQRGRKKRSSSKVAK